MPPPEMPRDDQPTHGLTDHSEDETQAPGAGASLPPSNKQCSII
jgi:hypothetical protein